MMAEISPHQWASTSLYQPPSPHSSGHSSQASLKVKRSRPPSVDPSPVPRSHRMRLQESESSHGTDLSPVVPVDQDSEAQAYGAMEELRELLLVPLFNVLSRLFE